MIEKYLHYLWEYKIIPFHQLSFSKKHQFKVLNYGKYNSFESGPDFQNALIELDNMIWCGNVEMHVRSSDWNKHKHHLDHTYDTVILHVVYEHDLEIQQNGFVIPTIELKSCIDWKHYTSFQSLLKQKNTILCGSQFTAISSFQRTDFLERSLFMRLSRKSKINVHVEDNSPQQYLFHFLSIAFGTKTNRLSFEELALRLTIKKLKKLDKKSIRAILLTASNINLNRKESSSFQMNKSSWRFGGVRPQNSPVKRLNQFAELIAFFDFKLDFLSLDSKEIISFFKEISDNSSANNMLKFSLSFQKLLLINGIVPFLFWYGNYIENEVYIEKAFDILNEIPPENNRIIKKWKHFNIMPKNAAESQAYLEIFNEFCMNKKCLTCSIGKQLLGK